MKRAFVSFLSIFTVSFFLYFLFSTSNVQAVNWCNSYATCHFQSGTGLICPSNPEEERLGSTEPFRFCRCIVYKDEGRCEKQVFNQCWSQEACNSYLQLMISCPEYRDCCGCSGKPKPTPSPTPKPRPTPTPTPSASCYQFCQNDSNCSNGLRCGYHVSVGRRVCLNPSCPSNKDCRCSWQKTSRNF